MTEPEINKGVELMLRRRTKEPPGKGIRIKHTLSLLGKVFQLRFEFTWKEETST
ncbi:hypothetical protein S170810_235 [Synechococcus phage S-CAM1]|jgi:hypothetical protein|uniref:Uncharacterized protein n=1 Tax=Synechococcus phage S-CAM1 TaxID=754037 RepID=A0A1D8KH49_9CAUD|nr:hypothetical protein N330309_235 [Synechococcus phage S-CAM1]AOV57737.1 hypothetical protein N170310_235 [Synechococcus phage S-CAM1]AOV57987.1 hypothetical protein C030809_235 [Synechococcus phage S-CAM1]AOV58237.1 hypothetical protein S170810_235 [Synechococcus phage S-CAM1]AOV58487.1 hypothetical protein C290910_235 [Synechococcus phage S-CAM1]|tara:strand:- start:129 stop:290 length:162 start_codon:yes stop_codon:yes gene_type:complete